MKEEDYLKLILPAQMLDYFKVTSVSLKDNTYYLYLEELNIHPVQFKDDKLTSKGFHEEVTIQDFPLRGKACYLKVKRRRWLNEDTGLVVDRDWKLVAKGTRMTDEFSAFLKGIIRQSSGKL